LAKRAGKEKKEYKISLISDTSYEKIRTLSEAPIEEVFTDSSYGKVIIFYLMLGGGEAKTFDIDRHLQTPAPARSVKCSTPLRHGFIGYFNFSLSGEKL
jgi:hypothetical protein